MSAVAPNASLRQEQLRISGQVQGVGFRPTVYRLAKELGLNGEVLNDGHGVLIRLQASAQHIDRFIASLQQHCPPLAHIEQIQRKPYPGKTSYSGFNIVTSQQSDIRTGVVPDAATCDACLHDIRDPDNRRYRYAFTNCTHCGPRLSIIRDIPYDRPSTSMAEFTMCPACQQEYENPADRRFHAQPNACPECGPALTLVDRHNHQVPCQDIISKAARLIEQGEILAIKGIGGFQLACDASNDSTLIKLRQRKRRPHKSFALMAADLAQIQNYCQVSKTEAKLIQSSEAPIVILQRRPKTNSLSPRIAPGQNTLGFMLPYSPLHHLLMRELEFPIVLTSGNASEEPQCIDNEQALERLTDITDYFVLHNRDIVNRIDDSVVREIDAGIQFYRRARGYAPSPITLADDLASKRNILALGGELKNTFALLQDNRATLSQHMGNLENLQTYDDYLKNLELYQRLFQFRPEVVAIDAHPEYLSSKLGRQMANELDLPLIEIQHHHAHIAACLADNGWHKSQGKVLGIALDGLGYGSDGSIWGGEFLLADYTNSERLGRFKPVALPGGIRALLEPWRNTFAHLYEVGNFEDLLQRHTALDLMQELSVKPWKTLERMIETETNAPLSSSCGRLFDAVAAALGLCRDHISYEGQAAIELEALINTRSLEQALPYPFEIQQKELLQINPVPMWQALLHDLHRHRNAAHIASRFHVTLAHMIAVMADKLRHLTGIGTIALSGGVFQNSTLLRLVHGQLVQRDFQLLRHKQVPANDGGLALGQAAIAAAQLQTGEN